jgi:predicted DNA-binding WGR domain protein
MAKRYFEYKDAKSKKFWEVSVSGKKVNIRYGKLGTDGQTSVKELGTPAEAKAHAEKQAAGKVKKGYKEAKVKAVKKAVKKVAKKKAVKKKTTKKKGDVNGQDVLGFIRDEYSIYDFIELTSAVLEMDEENHCETYEIRETGSKWSVDITFHYKDRGGDEPFPDSPRWDCSHQEMEFDGDGEDFKKWLKKNWKEVYDRHDWKDRIMALSKEQIKKFEKVEKEAEDSYSFKGVADDIADVGDKEWATRLYKKAEGKAEDCDDFSSLAYSIHEKLGDKEWAKKVYKKAEGKAENCDDFSSLAYSIHEKLGDKEWAKKVYKKAEGKAEDSDELRILAGIINETPGDKEWAKKIYKKAEGKAESSDEFLRFAYTIFEKFKDKEWAKRVYKKAENLAETSVDFCVIADDLCGNLGDKDLAKKVYEKAEEKAEDISDYESLAESIRDYLGDKKWAKLLDKKAKK